MLAALLLAALPALAQGPDLAAGRRVYALHCARCHGESGKGDGPASVALDPRPRDLTAGFYKLKSTPPGNLPTPADVHRTLRRGLPGSSMPAFEGLLDDAALRDVAGFVLGLAKDAEFRNAPPVQLGRPVPSSPESVARGLALYQRLGCAECHGEGLRGDGRSAGLLVGEFLRPTRPADLTAPWAYKGGADAGDIVLRLTAGLDGTPMPSYQDQTTLAQRWDLANFIVSLRRAPPWEAGGDLEAELAARRKDPVERGRRLARSMACGTCHTNTRASDGASLEDRELAGGTKFVNYPIGVFYAANLTSDPRTGLGKWSQADIERALKTGVRPGGRKLDLVAEPWAFTAALPDEDIAALAAYLKTVPPVENQVPQRLAFPYPEAVGFKLAHLLGRPATLDVHPGNAGLLLGKSQYADFNPFKPDDVPARSRRTAWVLFLLAVLLPVALAAAVLQWAFALDRRWKQALAVAGAGLIVAGAAAGLVALYLLPPTTLLPDYALKRLILDDAPAARAERSELQPVVDRGRVLVQANCMLCHTPYPLMTPPHRKLSLAGGTKVVVPGFGARYTRNLTPDPETGLGGWTESEVLRVLRSGIGRDGRQIPWNAMPWDRFSNMPEEDLRAVAAYLRRIPPVRHKVPEPDPGEPAGEAVQVHAGDSGQLLE